MFLIMVIATSCEKEISILQIRSESKLVLYAMPTDSDEFYINISATIPSAGYAAELNIQSVKCYVNGKEDAVSFVNEDLHQGMPLLIYKATGNHKCGDTISIVVEDAKLPNVSATTTIPFPADVLSCEIDTFIKEKRKYLHYSLMFEDGHGNGHYAVRVMEQHKIKPDSMTSDAGNDDGNLYFENKVHNTLRPSNIETNYVSIHTEYEPLFDKYIDSSNSVSDNYYRNLYIFSKDKSNDKVTKMNIIANTWYNYLIPEEEMSYNLQFFTLTPEYYLMIRHIDDQLNNELGESSFSPTTSTYTNVKGGYGVVAGYTVILP